MEHKENKTIIHDTEKNSFMGTADSNEGIRDQYSGKTFYYLYLN